MTLSERADYVKELRGPEKCPKCEVLRADLEAVTVALEKSVALNVALRRGQRDALDRIGLAITMETKEILKEGHEALARPGVQAVLEDKDR